MAETVAIQYTLFEIPATEPKRVRTKWEELKEMCSVSEEQDGLVPVHIAQVLLDVSRQRIYDMIDSGRVRSWEFFGKKMLSVNELMDFVNGERKAGRPVSLPPDTLKESFRRVKKMRTGRL